MVEDKKKLKSKGVNANVTKTKENVYFSDSDSFSQHVEPGKSIAKVKNDLQTVIDLMGPSTPSLFKNSSNDGDNEMSATSEESTKKSDKNKSEEEPSETYTQDTTDQTEPPDVTFPEDTDVSKVAVKNSSLEIPGFRQCVCPPPLIPANIVYNSECMCPQMASYVHKETASMPCMGRVQKGGRRLGRHKQLLYNLFRNIRERQHKYVPSGQYYTMNIKQPRDDSGLPKKLIFDLIGDGPRHSYLDDPFFDQPFNNMKMKDLKNFNNEQLSKEVQYDDGLFTHKQSVLNFERTSKKSSHRNRDTDTTRVDVYYFDRGDSNFLKTTDSPPVVMTENLAEKTEAYTTKFWAEVFGTLHIGVSFCISFVLQLFRFLLYSLLRPLTIGTIQLGTDYFLKPFIATFFNAIVQPPMLFLYNVSVSLRDICRPLAEGMGYFLREFAAVIKSFRIVDVRKRKITENVSNTEGENKDKKDEKTELGA